MDNEDIDRLYEKSDESYELYGKYNDAPSFNKIRIEGLEKELKELEEVASEENKRQRLKAMRELWLLYKKEKMTKEEKDIVKRGKALVGTETGTESDAPQRKKHVPTFREIRARQEQLYK